MDGIFPAGLHVATVSKVAPLEEGAYCYSIEAKATADRLEDLEVVFVMPPVAFDRKEEAIAAPLP
jgi:cell shape-determining protein MreC